MDLVFRVWNVAFLNKFGVARLQTLYLSGKTPVSGFCVATLETLCLSTDLAFRIWKRCACQCKLTVQSLEMLRFLTNMAFRGLETLCLSTNLVFSVETLSLSADLAFRIWKRCACQRISCSKSETVVPVSRFGVARLETLCLSMDLVFKSWKRCPYQQICIQNLKT